MPKSGFSANSQAKVAAMAVRGALTGSKSSLRNSQTHAGHWWIPMMASKLARHIKRPMRRLQS